MKVLTLVDDGACGDPDCCGAPTYSIEVSQENAALIAAAPDLLAALRATLDRYVGLVNCGDCGNWNPETESGVIAARTAIAKAEGR